MMTANPSRRWYRFALPSLLVSTTLSAIVIAYVAANYQLVYERRAAWPQFNEHSSLVRAIGVLPPDSPGAIPWIRKLLGDAAYGPFLYLGMDQEGQRQLERVRELFPEATIYAPPEAIEVPERVKRLEVGRYFIL